MLQRAGLIVWLSVAAAVQVVSAQETTPAGDPNEQVSADASSALLMRQGFDTVARQIFHRIMASQTPTGTLCAVVVLPGPADGVKIRLGVFNVATDRLDFLIMNSFEALGGAIALAPVGL